MFAILIAAASIAATPPLTALLERVRLAVPDARQISDLRVCDPQQVSRDGRRATVLVSLSRPQTARSYYRAVWRDGRFVHMDDLGLTGADDGLKGLAVRALERRFERCRWVPAEQLARSWAELEPR